MHPLSGGLAKVAIKARLSDSFIGKETKTKRMRPWLHQVEAYLEMQCLESNKEYIHFTETFLKEHT
jgi:hypothetical protein